MFLLELKSSFSTLVFPFLFPSFARDVRAVHPEAAWLSWQAWDARGPWGAGEAARALDME